jgi:hypothetical protein
MTSRGFPFDIFRVAEDFFVAFKPDRHLWEFVLPICGTPSILCKIDMKTFSIFGVAVVSRAEKLDAQEVVIKKMELWNIEVIAYAQVNKNVLVIMKSLQRIAKKLECLSCMHRVLCQEKEID